MTFEPFAPSAPASAPQLDRRQADQGFSVSTQLGIRSGAIRSISAINASPR